MAQHIEGADEVVARFIEEDMRLYGVAFSRYRADGTRERIDPSEILPGDEYGPTSATLPKHPDAS